MASKPPTLPFDPLLPFGINPVSFDLLIELCIRRFPLSQTRPLVERGLVEIYSKLVVERILGDLIIDGSLLTSKIDASDADLVLCVDARFYEHCNERQRTLLDWIENVNLKPTHYCDIYLCVEWPKGHPIWFEGIQDREFWTRLFSHSKLYPGVEDKGLALVALPGSAQ